jgi:hydroxymethylbilane synthase
LKKVAVLPRASHADVFVPRIEGDSNLGIQVPHTIATSSIRRKAQWLNRYPNTQIENLRGNVNTRLQKVRDSSWDGAIFAEAGLQRIGLLPANAQRLDWMLPAPAQGAITIVCRADDIQVVNACRAVNDPNTELCTQIERDFLRQLLGGCSTPISALAEVEGDSILFKGNILSKDGTQKVDIALKSVLASATDLGLMAAKQLLADGGKQILEGLNNGR